MNQVLESLVESRNYNLADLLANQESATITSIAKDANVSRNTIYRIIKSENRPSHELYCKICNAIGVDPAKVTKNESYYERGAL